jgi:hypothetical protein
MMRRVDSEHQFAESELDIEFGVVNQEGDASLPSFSTDVSDEEGALEMTCWIGYWTSLLQE